MDVVVQGVYCVWYCCILLFVGCEFLKIWWFEFVLLCFGMSGIVECMCGQWMQYFVWCFYVLVVDLGGFMIKVGQFMLLCFDVFLLEIMKEFEGLQDEVLVVLMLEVCVFVEVEFGILFECVYVWFDEMFVVVVLFGQVYCVWFLVFDVVDIGFEEVVVKVQ